jgi:flagellar capping protein FliD
MATTRTTKKAAKASKTTRSKTSKAPTKKAKRTDRPRDQRLPEVGAKLTRTFKGKEIVVEVVEGGFKFEGQTFKSISACARHITGYMISGPVFFRLAEAKPVPEAK